MNKLLLKRLTLLLGLALAASGCVTTTTGGGPPVNEDRALKTHIRTGMAYLQQNNQDAAKRHFKSALEIDDDSAEAWQGLAILRQLNGEIDLAEKAFEKALDGDASISTSSVHVAYGRFLYEQERYQDAYEHFETAAGNIDYPGRALALVLLGQTAQKLDKPERAKAAFEHALNLDKRLPQAVLELAHMAYAERDYPRAKAYLDRFDELTEHTPRSLWLGIRIERIFGNKNKEASYALALENLYPYSKESLAYKRLIESNAD